VGIFGILVFRSCDYCGYCDCCDAAVFFSSPSRCPKSHLSTPYSNLPIPAHSTTTLQPSSSTPNYSSPTFYYLPSADLSFNLSSSPYYPSYPDTPIAPSCTPKSKFTSNYNLQTKCCILIETKLR